MTRRTKTRVMMMTTGRVLVGTQPAASLHRKRVAEDTTETTVTYATSSVVEMHAVELKTSAVIRSEKSKNGTMKGTMITMVLTTTNITGSSHQRRDISQEVSRRTPKT
jgi:hypothetical protein